MKHGFYKKIVPVVVIFYFLFSCSDKAGKIEYSIGKWDSDSLGYHRVVLRVNKKSDAVFAHIEWRRCDESPENKGFILVDGTSEKRVNNVMTINISREACDIIFQPQSVPSDYYLYYLPGKPPKRSNYPRVKYPGPFRTADSIWALKYKCITQDEVSNKSLSFAEVKAFQSSDEFNSFYPMEVIATKEETNRLIKKYNGIDFLVFTEERTLSIRMKNDLPQKWIEDKPFKPIKIKALKNEYVTFQLGVYPVLNDLRNIKVKFSDLTSEVGGVLIKSEELTCFNLSGRNWDGTLIQESLDVKKGTVQALWCGLIIPEDLKKSTLKGKIFVTAENCKSVADIDLKIDVCNRSIVNHGDNEPWRMTRLRWLNSDKAFNDELVKPYTAVKRDDRSISILGRRIVLDDLGLPAQYFSHFTPDVTSVSENAKDVLAGPMTFSVETNKPFKEEWENALLIFDKENKGIVSWKSKNSSKKLDMLVNGSLEADGFASLMILLIAKEDINLSNAHFYIPFSKDFSKYMMGLGLRGGLRPMNYHWKWNRMLHQEGAWIGGVNGGIQFALRDDKYIRPLNTNFYRDKPLLMPYSWYNDGKGGINISSETRTVMVDNYSGSRTMKTGDTLHFYINLLLTPFKTIDTDQQWSTRFYHRYGPVDTVMKYGANTINIHHANEINPWINYPFLEPIKMKAYIDEAHSNGMKVKIYYTIRELSNRAPEIFAIRSLGNEVFSGGPGGGFNWLQEHLREDYIPGWFVPAIKDAAIINAGMSRWHNYYIEGLNWLTKEMGIDGLYLDDVAFDRTTMKRVRKVLDSNREGALIDLHSANQYNVRDGFTNSANLYMEHFPYINRLWFGEYFDRDLPPDFWLVEMSGIPFGLMGEMLQDGGNQYRGMLYGMTSRVRYSGDPRGLWKAWDKFGMTGSKMTGYWSENCPVITNYPTIPATVYSKNGCAMVAIASWDTKVRHVRLIINWQKFGFDMSTCDIVIPPIQGFQDEQIIKHGDPITIKPAEGKIIIFKPK